MSTATLHPNSATISADEALSIVRPDAELAYGALNDYSISIQLQSDGWHIDFELPEPEVKGGGPHYVVDARSGVIAFKRYDQ